MAILNFNITNTWELLEKNKAPLSRNGKSKINKWKIILSINENKKYINSVVFKLNKSFNPSSFVKTRIPYITTQYSYSNIENVNIEIYIGKENKKIVIPYKVQFIKNPIKISKKIVYNNDPSSPLSFYRSLPIPEDITFGIEIELTLPYNIQKQDLAYLLTNSGILTKVENYNHTVVNYWKITDDSSITCGRESSCNTLELVSPILRGTDDLKNISKLFTIINKCNAKINDSTGFHVHVGKKNNYNLQDLKKIAHNYLKYESAIDLVMPLSRKGNNNSMIKSNRLLFPKSNKETRLIVENIKSIDDFLKIINNNDKHFKINFLSLSRQNTIEFRHHGGTLNIVEADSWIRFVILFVYNSIHSKNSKNFKNSNKCRNNFVKMFDYVIKDEYLYQIYNKKKQNMEKIVGNVCTCLS